MIEIEEYQSQISITELTDLIHRSYQQLADLGFKYWGSHQTDDDTRKRISNGMCFVALKDTRVVGTVVLNSPDLTSFHPMYKSPKVTSFHQFAVDPIYQKQGVGSKMMDFVEQKAKTLGLDSLLCDTAEDATHLVNMYLARGYEIVEKTDWEITNYTSVILRKHVN